jgi:predicted transcriptional regulator
VVFYKLVVAWYCEISCSMTLSREEEGMTPEPEKKDNPLLENLTKIALAYMDRNTLQPEQVPPLLEGILNVLFRVTDAGMDRVAAPVLTTPHEAASQEPAEPTPSSPRQPAVPIEQSITPDHIICLEDGAETVLLKRHLRAKYNMTPQEYRDRWGLPRDYPMVAPTYSKRRSAAAKAIGLGQRRPVEPSAEAAPPVPQVAEPTPVSAAAAISPAEPTARRPRARKAAAAASIVPSAVTEGGRRSRATRGKSAAAPTEAQTAITEEAPSGAPSSEKKKGSRATPGTVTTSKPRVQRAKSTA